MTDQPKDPATVAAEKIGANCIERECDSWRFDYRLAANIIREAYAQAWQPIETAPKDGTNILGCVQAVQRSQGEMFWYKDRWVTWDGENHTRTVMYPTHWMPLPEPPK